MNIDPPMSEVLCAKWVTEKINIKTKKNPAIYFLKLGSQISNAAAICMTPKIDQIIGEILLSSEQGGSRKDKNLSIPIIKKSILQRPTMILDKFIFFNF